MINVNEIRIGNVIQRRGKLLIVIGILEPILRATYQGLKSDYVTEDDQLHYIPITPEILVQCGFKMVGKEPFYSMRFYLNSTDELCWYSQDSELRYQTRGSGFTRYFNTKYLHQLQNLYFALTGIELSVNIETSIHYEKS